MDIKDIDNYDFSYRKSLNFSSDISFGVEIEYLYADSKNISSIIKPFEGIRNTKWKYQVEPSFTTIKKESCLGGEIASPIYKNRKKYLKELEYVANMLKYYNADVGFNTSLQVHVSLDCFQNNPLYLLNFLKLFCNYEDIIFEFGYYGDKPRDVINDYSKSISYELFKSIPFSKDYGFNYLFDLVKDICEFKKSSLCFRVMDEYPGTLNNRRTVEFRMFNGTINPIYIENNINLCCSLIDASIDKNLKCNFNNYDETFFKNHEFTFMGGKKDLRRALELANIIYQKDEDKKSFLKQYKM